MTTGLAVRRDGRDVLLHDELGVLTLRRLRPWHRVAARGAAARLDRELAAGASPEASARLAARASRLRSAKYRRDLAASVLRLLAAAAEPGAVVLVPGRAGRPPRLPLCRARIRQAGPLLADGTGPLYRAACDDDLDSSIERALTLLL